MKELPGSAYGALQEVYKLRGATWEEINIFGVRNLADPELDKFNDLIGYAAGGKVLVAKGTTDPGVKYTALAPKGGAAHLCQGYYKRAYNVGIHLGGSEAFHHEALVQQGEHPVKIWRDANKDFKFEEGEPVEEGYFGINIHRASANRVAENIEGYSAGCQVVQDVQDFALLMSAAKLSGQRFFSYFLFTVDEVRGIIGELI